jgi:hypothetical protein
MTDTTDTTKAAADAALRFDLRECIAQTIMACKSASGQHRAIDNFVNGVDITNAMTAKVGAAIERARADERNRCKQVCEAISDQYREREGLRYPELRSDAEEGAGACAAAIEALGTTMINGLTRAETDASASCAGLSAKTQEGRKA